MSNKTIKVALAGAGAFGIKHLDGIKNIDGVEVVSLVGRELAKTQEVADKYGIQHVTTELADSLALPEVDAVILCTPTQMHAAQAIECLKAGKHVQVEIPLADSLKDAQALEMAHGAGIDVIVVDHHKCSPDLPPATALVNPNRLDEMRAKLPVLEERLSLVEIESQSLEQAHEAKLAELASKVARHQLSDSVILAARQYVCKQLGLHEALFNRMWNRHVGLAPAQLKARFNGEDGTGSLGQPVPGHTTRVGASSYATPELALKALFDVSEVIQNAELAGGVGHTVVQHGVPVGLSAIPPEGEIKTVAATLVEITPASAVERRRLHITPVTVPQDISLTSEVAKQVHQLNT